MEIPSQRLPKASSFFLKHVRERAIINPLASSTAVLNAVATTGSLG
jgi:hypothetical protein